MIGLTFDAQYESGKLELHGAGATMNGCRVVNIGSRTVTINLLAGHWKLPDHNNQHEAADFATIVDCNGFPKIIVGVISSDPNYQIEGSWGAWPNGVRIYRGDDGWNPTLEYGTKASASPSTCPNVAVNTTGLGGYSKVTPVTLAQVSGTNAGCDAE